MTVQTIPAIEDMTPSQRADLMEDLWNAMSRNPKDIEPPDWHRKVLEERELALANGEDEFIDWEDAKRYIQQKTVGAEK
jgi:hypothetical protein